MDWHDRGERLDHQRGRSRPRVPELIADFPIDGYGEAFADIYDTWYSLAADTGPTVDLVASLADGRPVLELGVGTGRVACALAMRGLDVWGVDASQSMLDRLAGKPGGDSVRAVVGDMEGLELPETAPEFGVVFAAFNTLFCLPTDEAQGACLKRASDVLTDSGRVIVELYVPGVPPAIGTRQYEIDMVTAEGAVLKVYEWWPDEELLVGEHMEVTSSGVRRRPWRMHPLAVDRVDALAGAASLELDARYASWDYQTFTPLSSRHVSIYRKRAEPSARRR
jgi:SAM-dependent methyltransferase